MGKAKKPRSKVRDINAGGRKAIVILKEVRKSDIS
jgi:hypothetical protein